MEILFGVLMGIFVGIACAGYIFIQPIADRDKLIDKQKEENLQVCHENKDLRSENEDLRFDLSAQLERENSKDEIVMKMKKQIERNNYNRDDLKIAKLKELVNDYQSIN